MFTLVDEDSLDLFKSVELHAVRRATPYQHFIDHINRLSNKREFRIRRGISERARFSLYREPSKSWQRRLLVEYFMLCGDEILTSTGRELRVLAYYFQVDLTLPIREQQERVYEAIENEIMKDRKWSSAEIKQQKALVLKHLKEYHFLNIVCDILDIKASTVRGWIRTDPEFSDAVRSEQVRHGEQIARALMNKALEGDLGAQMYALKEFGNDVQPIEPATRGESVTADLDVSRLSADEQEQLWRLLTKAKTGEEFTATQFIEDDSDEYVAPALPAPSSEPRVFVEDDSDLSEGSGMDDGSDVVDVIPYDKNDDV